MKTYTAASLVRTYRAARQWEPDQPFVKIDWCTTLTAREWLAWFQKCLAEKINHNSDLGPLRRGLPRQSSPAGRKLAWEWQRDCRNLARDLERRIMVYRSHYPIVLRDLHGRLDHHLES